MSFGGVQAMLSVPRTDRQTIDAVRVPCGRNVERVRDADEGKISICSKRATRVARWLGGGASAMATTQHAQQQHATVEAADR